MTHVDGTGFNFPDVVNIQSYNHRIRCSGVTRGLNQGENLAERCPLANNLKKVEK